MRHHVARKELVALACRGGVLPVVPQCEMGTETTVRLFEQSFDLSDCLIGCSDHTEPTVDEVDHLVDVAAFDRHLRKGGNVLEVTEPSM